MIRVRNLSFSYPHSGFDLRISDLTIAPSCSTAIVGPSGSGKTTLLHLIAGILTTRTGTVSVDDVVLSQLSDAQRRRFRLSHIGLVFQEFELIEYLSVLDNVLLPCRISNTLPLNPETRKRALSLLEQAGLNNHISKSVTRLSQGERQRVAICRALLPRPTFLLADEPTGNLDPNTTRQILDLLQQRVREENSTLVMVTHDHSLLNRFDETLDFNRFLTVSDSPSGAPQ